MRLGRPFALLLVAALVAPASAAALVLEPVGDYSRPVYVTSDPGDPDRLFVVEEAGRIMLTENGVTTTFLDLTSLVLFHGEDGLLSMAFAPDYASSGRLYVYYTRKAPPGDHREGDIQIDELVASGDVADLATRRRVLTIDQRPGSATHNGGQLQFGPDGYLYIATGDGGRDGDEFENGQSKNTLLGKILRIDPRQGGSHRYAVPPDNPFVGRHGADEIWSYGFRNPWRFSFDRATGDLLIGDVGESRREEVDYAPAPARGRGFNFGWDCFEGTLVFETHGCTGPFVDPIFEYPNDSSTCAITGGYVVRDPSLGDLFGRYLYADFCAGELRSLVPGLPLATGDRSEGQTVSLPTSFGEDSCARIYVASLNGPVSRLVGDQPASC